MPNYGLGNDGLQVSQTIIGSLFAFSAIALYNTIELIVLIFMIFKRYSGLYFWSLLLATAGILPYTLGLLFNFFGVIRIPMLTIPFIAIGWHLMVTGQSVVLYSRFHLVTTSDRLPRAILSMIIINWFISNVPTTIFVFGSSSPAAWRFTRIYGIWERVQVVLYFVQESVISALYITKIISMLRPSEPEAQAKQKTTILSRKLRSPHVRKVMKSLVCVNLLLVLLDIVLLAMEFSGHYEIQVMFKVSIRIPIMKRTNWLQGFVYSVKLKMEFRILNNLTSVASHRMRSSQAIFSTNTTGVSTASAYDVEPLESPGASLAGEDEENRNPLGLESLQRATSGVTNSSPESLTNYRGELFGGSMKPIQSRPVRPKLARLMTSPVTTVQSVN